MQGPLQSVRSSETMFTVTFRTRLQLPGLSVPYLHVYSSLHCLCETVFCFTGQKYNLLHPSCQPAHCTKHKPRERFALSVLHTLLESGLLAPVCFPGRFASLVGDPAGPTDDAALPPSPVSGRFTAPARADESDDGVRPEVRRMQQMQRMKSQRMQEAQMQTGKAAPAVSPMTSPASADPNPSPAPAAPAAASASSASAGSSAPQTAPASSPAASAAPISSATPISSAAPAASGSERPDTQTGE